MPVRLATRADIPIMATVLAAGFGPDRLFQVMFPHQKEHPDAFIQAMEESLWLAWYDYSKILVVSYLDTPTEEQQRQIQVSTERTPLLSTKESNVGAYQVITGVAEWKREGKGWESLYGVWGRWDPRLLIRPILATFYSLRRRIFPNKSSAQPTPDRPAPLTYWNFVPSIIPFTSEFFSAPYRQIHWSLENLAVHPDHQGRGHGRQLVEQGLEVSRNDEMGSLPVCVVAADGKEVFYQKCGFNDLVGWVSRTFDDKGRDNPMRSNGVGGGAVLWTV